MQNQFVESYYTAIRNSILQLWVKKCVYADVNSEIVEISGLIAHKFTTQNLGVVVVQLVTEEKQLSRPLWFSASYLIERPQVIKFDHL